MVGPTASRGRAGQANESSRARGVLREGQRMPARGWDGHRRQRETSPSDSEGARGLRTLPQKRFGSKPDDLSTFFPNTPFLPLPKSQCLWIASLWRGQGRPAGPGGGRPPGGCPQPRPSPATVLARSLGHSAEKPQIILLFRRTSVWVSTATAPGASCAGSGQCRARAAPSPVDTEERGPLCFGESRISRLPAGVLQVTEARPGVLETPEPGRVPGRGSQKPPSKPPNHRASAGCRRAPGASPGRPASASHLQGESHCTPSSGRWGNRGSRIRG